MTDARASGEEDRSRRMKQYLLAMGIRTLSFPLAVWAFVQEFYVLAGVLAVLAAIIPSFAVMLANAVDRRQAPSTDEVLSPALELGPGTQPSAPAQEPGRSEVITGTVVDRHETTSPAQGEDKDEDEPPCREAS